MLLRRLVFALDAIVRRCLGVFTFSADEDCLLRLERGKAPRRLVFAGRVVEKGAPVLYLHLWNEHLPPFPAAGPTLAWAKRGERLFRRSLAAVAEEIRRNPRLADIRAVGGVTALFGPSADFGGARFLERLGFHLAPYRSRWGRFGMFWKNLYAAWLLWAYNPAAYRRHGLKSSVWTEFWLPVEEFLARFGPNPPQGEDPGGPGSELKNGL